MNNIGVLPCITCGFVPEEAFPGREEGSNHPYKATVFNSYGHYGSTFFDPMDSSFIEINVCDACLEKAVAFNRVLEYIDQVPRHKNTKV